MTAVKQLVSSLVGTSPVSLYTWSSGSAECESLDICNRLTSVVNIDVYLDNNGTSVYIAKTFPLQGGALFSYRGAIPLVSTGQIVKVVSDTAASLDVIGRVTEF